MSLTRGVVDRISKDASLPAMSPMGPSDPQQSPHGSSRTKISAEWVASRLSFPGARTTFIRPVDLLHSHEA